MRVTAERERGERTEHVEPPVEHSDVSTAALLRLQRSAGNQAVARLLAERRLQREPGDEDEVEGNDNGREDRKRKRDPTDTGGAAAPPTKRNAVDPTLPVAPLAVGNYVKDAAIDKFAYWTSTDDKWHFTYFTATGDYHLKGNKGAAVAYGKGFFGGQFQTKTEGRGKKASAAAQLDGAQQYLFCVQNIVPLYANLPSYRGQQF